METRIHSKKNEVKPEKPKDQENIKLKKYDCRSKS